MAKREKIVTAGRMVYCVSYPIPKYRMEDTERQRGERRRATGEWKAKINRLKSCEKLEQLIFANFRPGDRYVTLTYREECLPSDRRQVMQDVKWFRRKLALRRQPRGQPCRYIYAPEHKHGEGRWHAHMILNGCGPGDLDDIRECWTKGYAQVKWFALSQGEELASYLSKEKPDHVGEHPWIASRGLLRPEVDSRLVPDSARLAVPPGAVVKQREQVQNSYGAFEYIKYFLP